MANIKDLKGVSDKDKAMIAEAEAMFGPEPGDMGFIKNLFWGRIREELVFPYPEDSPELKQKADAILEKLEVYLKNEHPSVEIDQEQYIPEWVVKKLFDLGVMGMNIPTEYGGQGLGVTGYNRALEMIGAYCGSTSVMVSAHQSIGCKAIVLYGTEAQKKKWLPKLAKDTLSAFALSEPNVGCDAGGQETRVYFDEKENCYVLNGEKKWSTSGALSGMFTVMAKQKITDKRGKEKEVVSAFICTPDMQGLTLFEKNRSKCGIRGTWQARFRFKNLKIPKENLLHQEGKGLIVALTCLNYGRCTLSAGMTGSAKRSMDQAIKYAMTRHQFQRPIADFELVREKIAKMAALCYASESMLYMTTCMLDRHDKDIMVETATCKVFASEMGWRVINHAMQIMGGEGYMTENELERAFRDSRIYPIVEGANEVMQAFIFGYGGKQLAEHMLGVKNAFFWDTDRGLMSNLVKIIKSCLNFRLVKVALKLGFEIGLGVRKKNTLNTKFDPALKPLAQKFTHLVGEHNYWFKKASMIYKENIVTRQCVQARLSDSAMWLHAMACVLSKLNSAANKSKKVVEWDRDFSAGNYFIHMAAEEIRLAHWQITHNSDIALLEAAQKSLAYNETLPDSDYIIHEKSPTHQGRGRKPANEHIKQFP